MRTQTIITLFILIAMCVLGLMIVAFSSVTATECVAHIKGGKGTVQDPYIIEIEGNAGLAPLLDSLLPFRAIPAIRLSYVGERFYIPGINECFSGHQKLAKAIYLVAILLFIILGFWGVLRLAGKRIAIDDH